MGIKNILRYTSFVNTGIAWAMGNEAMQANNV